MVSLKGRMLLEQRGQVVSAPDEYLTAVESEWLRLHRTLENAGAKGNYKVQTTKFKVKGDLLTKFSKATLDQAFLLIHGAADKVEHCSDTAMIESRGSSIVYTDKLEDCVNKV